MPLAGFGATPARSFAAGTKRRTAHWLMTKIPASASRDVAISLEDPIMNDVPPPPFIYDGLDPVPEPQSTIAGVSEAVRNTANRIGDAVEAGKKPGMPLSVLSNITRQAPLGALLVAFLLGLSIARRR
jgi:hypothetical protein